jgi:hypothetical protein
VPDFAEVVEFQTFGDRADQEFVGDPVGYGAGVSTVSVVGDRFGPEPAGFGLLDSGPEENGVHAPILH